MFAIRVLVYLWVTGFCYCDFPSNVGIYGGHQVAIEDAPFMASVRYKTYHWCGGSIVNTRFVLTAAHCIERDLTYNILVETNIAEGYDFETGGTLYEIEEYIFYKDEYIDENLDLCLIKLSTPIVIGEKVKVIELADNARTLSVGTMLNVTGWGRTENSTPKYLMQVSVPVVDRKLCQDKYLGYKTITSDMMCAGVDGKDSCRGDSGGPLTIGNVQYGITYFGRGCGTFPGIYVMISEPVRKWIQKISGNM